MNELINNLYHIFNQVMPVIILLNILYFFIHDLFSSVWVREEPKVVVNLGLILNILFFMGILVFVGSLHMHQLAVIFVKQPWLILLVFIEVICRIVLKKYKKHNTHAS